MSNRVSYSQIVIIHQNDGTDVRVGKLCRTLSKYYDVTFIGWDRRCFDTSVSLGKSIKHIMRYKTTNGRNTLVGFFLFYFYCIYFLLKIRPKVVTVVNEELTFMLLPLKYIIKCKLICEVFDPFADRNSNSLFVFIFKFIQNLSRKLSDQLVVTDANRKKNLGSYAFKSIIIENYPDSIDDSFLESEIDKENCIVAVVGSLSKSRGIEYLLKAAELVGNVKIYAAGWLYDDYSRDIFIKSNLVTYFGILSLHDSLVLQSKSTVILCLYDPSNLNNLNASPNKIYDALQVGRPVILNSELLVSDFVSTNNLGYLVRYGNLLELCDVLSELKKNLHNFTNESKRLRNLSKKYTWDIQEKTLINIYTNLLTLA